MGLDPTQTATITRTDAPRARVTLATYNVHACVGTDGRLDTERIARVIARLPADVIGLQEVAWPADHGAEPSLREALALASPTLRGVWAPAYSRAGLHFGNVLLTRLPIVETRTLDLSYRTREPRIALAVELGSGDACFRVITTHLGLLPQERREQVKQIVAWATHSGDSVTALMGDINEWFMLGRPLSWLHRHFGRSPSVASFPSRLPLLSLDRIWTHPAGALRRVWAHAEGEAARASDHLPVLAELAW